MSVNLHEIDKDSLAALLPVPCDTANKYTRGKLFAIGGSSSYPGAIALASSAAERMGAGYVEVYCDSASLLVTRLVSKSIVARPWDLLCVRTSSLSTYDSKKPQACLVGSGFDGKSDVERSLLFDVIADCVYPVVVDGGAIGYLASEAGIDSVRKRSMHSDYGSLVITPHFGEAKKLSQAASISVPSTAALPKVVDRLDDEYALQIGNWAYDLANAYKATVVLKGPDTFIACPEMQTVPETKTVEVMRFGTGALSKAGTGDVLAGLLASLLAQGVSALDSSVLASSLHALSAVLASKSLSEICVCAEDIICFLPEIVISLLQR